MAKKALYIWVAAGGMALAVGAAWWLQNPQARPFGAKPGADEPRAAGAQAAAGGQRAAGGGTGQPAAGGLARPGGGPGGAPGAGGPGGGGGPVGVEVAKVKSLTLQDDAQSVGTLRSRQSVMLRPEVSGRVSRIAFNDGARVQRGQLLVQLDDVLQRAELSQAQAQLSIARANLRRNEELVAQAFVAQRVLDESRASLQVAEAQVALAQARLSRMRIVAPFDATAGIRTVNLGDYVKDGADLVNLEDTSQLTVDFRLPERYQNRVSAGQSVQVELDALPGKRYAARVVATDPLLDANGRSIAVRAALPPNAGSELRPGMFARVTTVFAVNDAALVVPEEAILPQAGKQFVVMLDKQGEGDGAKLVSRRVEVQLGVRRGAQVQITQGVAEGDTVVVAGQQRLQRDGTAVRVVDMSRPGGGRPGGPRPEGAQGGPATPAAPATPGAPAAPAAPKPAAG